MANFSLQGFIINGIASGDLSGYSVSNAGDINGDGIDDLVIGASGSGINGNVSGQSYVVFGSSNGFVPIINLSTLNGSNGFTINGLAAGDQLGYSVSDAGDINGDGIDDLIIGANLASPNGVSNAGRSYVIFGSRSGFGANFNLSKLNGSNGFIINGIALGDRSSTSVSRAGDVNGDGVDDLIIGARSASPNGETSGQAYVVFGSRSGFSTEFDLATLNGNNGFILNGEVAGDNLGVSVSEAGDINGDGIDDLIVGASADPIGATPPNPNNPSPGQSYVVFGSRNGFDASIDLSTLDGSNGFKLNGITADDRSGYAVSTAGDINGDGIDDLLIGSYFASPNGISYAGQSYVVFGSSHGFSDSLDLSTLNGSNGFKINGIAELDVSGAALSSAGDVNGDGLDDLIIGAPYAAPNGTKSGQSYVIFGSRNGFSADIDLANLNGKNGFKINGGQGTIAGVAVSAGDLNGDGINDLIIGAAFGSPNGNSLAGQTYVVFGQVGIGSSGTIELSELVSTPISGTPGNDVLIGTPGSDFIEGFDGDDNIFGLDGNDQLFGGTGADILIGGGGNDRLLGQEGADIIYGDSQTLGIGGNDTIDGGDGADLIFGGAGNDSILGGQGADKLNGDAGDDTIDGGNGDDVVFGSDGNDSINGGSGNDVLNGGNGNDTINGGAGNDILIGTPGPDFIEGFDGDDNFNGGAGDDRFFAGTGNDQVLGQSGNDYIKGEAGNDFLDGGAGQDVIFGARGNDTLSGGDGIDLLIGEVDNDSLTGGSGNDFLIGVDPFFSFNGFGGTSDNPFAPFEIDTLTGGIGSDTFFLGGDGTLPNINGAVVGAGTLPGNPELYYFGGGNADYALITDFKPSEDTIKLPSNISFSDLVLGISTGENLPKGTTLSYKGDLIAILQGTFLKNSLINSIRSFEFSPPNSSTGGGTAGNDILVGTLGASDFIDGLAGDDNIFSLDGDDQVFGGTGNDILIGGLGNDRLFGQEGADVIYGDAQIFGVGGNDTIDGGDGADLVFGEAGNDSIFGGGGADQLNGDAGDDTIDSGNDDDIINGGDGNDIINGGDGNDILSGGTGDDRFFAGTGNDQVLGQSGDDYIQGDGGNNLLDGGLGQDTVDYSTLGQTITLKPTGIVDKASGLGTDTLIGIETIIASTLADDTINASSVGTPTTGIIANLAANSLTVTGANTPLPLNFTVLNFENVTGTNFNDTLTGNSQNNKLVSNVGDDVFIGSAGNDTLDGGVDSDTVNYSDLGQTITLKAAGIVDKAGGLGTDTLIKVDTIIASALDGDTIEASTAFAPATGIIANLITNSLITTGVGAPFPINTSVFNFENVSGTSFNDTITGDSQNNKLIGNAGNDTIDGGAGNDNIDGGIGNDSLNGGLGNDSVAGGDRNDTLTGSVGNDTLNGGTGSDTANYSKLGQTITLTPTGIVDKASGLGTDTLIGVETIIASTLAGDTIDASSAGTPTTGIIANLAANSLTVTGANASLPLNFTVIKFENVTGTNFNDTLTGNSQNNKLIGNAGNDTFIGSAGNDTLDGGLGTNTANYSTLGQVITLKATGIVDKAGGLGIDTLIKVDTIIASSLASDTIDASTAFAPATGIIANLAANAVTIIGNGVPFPLSFAVVNFENVTGTNFDDTIIGNSSNNKLVGNAGDDTFFGSIGNDTLEGGAGSDTVNYNDLGQAITLNAGGIVDKAGGLGIDTLITVDTIIASALDGDTIDASTAFAPATGIVANLATNTLITTGSGAIFPINTSVFNFENVNGTSFNDTITGDLHNNKLAGNDGNDTLVGGGGDDSLNGGLGSDSLTGVNPLSITPGTNEIDSLTGGNGADRCVIADSAKLYYQNTSAVAFGVNDYARITDFQSGVDKLILKSGVTYFTSLVSPVAGITGNIFIFQDNAVTGTLTKADDLVATITGTFVSSDVIFV